MDEEAHRSAREERVHLDVGAVSFAEYVYGTKEAKSGFVHEPEHVIEDRFPLVVRTECGFEQHVICTGEELRCSSQGFDLVPLKIQLQEDGGLKRKGSQGVVEAYRLP